MGTRQPQGIQGRYKGYKAHKMGAGPLQGVEDIYEGYETGTSSMRQLSELQNSYEVGTWGWNRHKENKADTRGTRGIRQVQGV